MAKATQSQPTKSASSFADFVSSDLADSLTAWQDWLSCERRLSPHTCQAYRFDAYTFVRFVAHAVGSRVSFDILQALPLTQMRAFLSARHNEGVGVRSRARCLSSLRSLAGFLMDQHGVHIASLALVRGPKVVPSLPKPVDQDEILQLLAFEDGSWLTARDRALFGLLYGCGLRLAEALSLTGNALDGDTLRVVGKGSRTRIVPILDIVKNYTQSYQQACPYPHGAQDILFIGARGGRLNPGVARARLQLLGHRLGLSAHLSPHALRHSFATHLLQSSGRLRVIQELLGHRDLRATQAYVKVGSSQLRDIHEKSHPRHWLEVK